MNLNTQTTLPFTRLLAIGSMLCFGAANAQTLSEFALTLPTLSSKHIVVGQLQTARVGVYNGCTLPIDIEVHVTPYAPRGVVSADYEPYTIPMTISGQGFQYGDTDLHTEYDAAHADIEIVPAPTQAETNSCFAPGQDLIQASVGVFSSLDGSIRNVYPIKFKGPSNSASQEGISFRPLSDRVVVEPVEASLMPVNPGDILQISAGNECETTQKAAGSIFVVNGTDGPTPLSIDLEPGEHEVLSIVPVSSGIPPVTEGYWVLLSPLLPGEYTPSPCFADNIKVGLIYKPASGRF